MSLQISSKVQGRPSPLRPWCISPYFRFPPYFRKCLRLSGKFYLFQKKFHFHPPKFLTTFFFFFLVIHYKFRIPPYFASFSTFPHPDSRQFIISPYFSKFPPSYQKIQQLFTYFTCISPHTLTMMHLCITQCTYWTLLPKYIYLHLFIALYVCSSLPNYLIKSL